MSIYPIGRTTIEPWSRLLREEQQIPLSPYCLPGPVAIADADYRPGTGHSSVGRRVVDAELPLLREEQGLEEQGVVACKIDQPASTLEGNLQ